MAVYLIERSLRQVRSGISGARSFRPGPVTCLFEATGPELVKELNEQAKIPFTRIVEAMDLTP
jgi:hypothetical protein